MNKGWCTECKTSLLTNKIISNIKRYSEQREHYEQTNKAILNKRILFQIWNVVLNVKSYPV